MMWSWGDLESYTMIIQSEPELLDAIREGRVVEHRYENVELKRAWDAKYGNDISALANRQRSQLAWFVVGVENDGKLARHDEDWVKKYELTISQQLNERLSPIQACRAIKTANIDDSWIIFLALGNPGDVVYWGTHAYTAAGTTSRVLEPSEVLELRLLLPGLSDYSRQNAASQYDEQLVARFVDDVTARTVDQHLPREPGKLLGTLGIDGRQVARLLFGDTNYRTVVYDRFGNVIVNSVEKGLYGMLRPTLVHDLQKRASVDFSFELYSPKALHEALANAVAHAAYFEKDGEVMVELYPDRMVISNLCVAESKYFANRWFSRSHYTINGLLMETLRIAGHVDELGRGKGLIFSEALRAGRRPPEVVLESAGRLRRWKLALYITTTSAHYSRLLERCRSVYEDEMKALIAVALVFWRSKKVSEIREHVDGDFATQFAEVLSSLEGPIFYSREADEIFLTRWAQVLLGEGKDSKELSRPEEERLKAHAHERCWKAHGGEITPSILRNLGQMGNTPSEKSLSSRILKKWVSAGVVSALSHGRYRFVDPPIPSTEVQKLLAALLEELQSKTNGSPTLA